MAQLYGDLFKIENIKQAIKFILKLNNEETNNQYLINKKIIQNIKQYELNDITGKKLNSKSLHIHHINSDYNFNNLLLISKSSHRLIHSNIQTDSQIVLYYRHKCCK